MLCSLILSSLLAADPLLDLSAAGAFGFPQKDAIVLCKTDDVRLSAWNNDEYLFVQAVVYPDNADFLGETDDGRQIGDQSQLLIDIDADGAVTADLDRSYSLNPWPSLPGLHYSVELGHNASTGLQKDSKGRGAISYPVASKAAQADAAPIRVDTFLIPLAELGAKKAGDTIKLAYWASSTKPEATFNSVGFVAPKPKYWPHHLPREKWHAFTLASNTAEIDIQAVPEGRGTIAIEQPVKKPTPLIGVAPPEITAETWINAPAGSTPSLASLKGKVVVVEFWATWCGPCVQSIPHLNELQQKHDHRGLVILSMTDQSSRAIEKFLSTHRMQTIVGCKSGAINDYGVNGIPHAFIIDRDGLLRWHGHPQEPSFETELDAALAKR